MVREHYAKLGFSPAEEPDHWSLDLAAFNPRAVRMKTVVDLPEPA